MTNATLNLYKKLIIMTAAVCLGFAAQAIDYIWSVSGVKDYTGTSLYSGSATLYFEALGKQETITAYMTDGKIEASGTFLNFSDELLGADFVATYVMYDGKGHKYEDRWVDYASYTVNMNTWIEGKWSNSPDPEPVPEPTSGLLMLLGLAGLALKRKNRE